MLIKIKSFKRRWSLNKQIFKEYLRDFLKYAKWNYHNSRITTLDMLQSEILRQTHIIEKGMSLSNPRPQFGVKKVLALIDMVNNYSKMGYDIDSSFPVKNALGVISAYLDFHKKRGFEPKEILDRLQKYRNYFTEETLPYGIKAESLDELNQKIRGDFYTFFNSRHSVRQFSSRPMDIIDIQKAVSLAMKAPSACNRQSCKVYFYKDKAVNDEIGKLIPGNTGFDHEVQNYLIITSNISAFYDAFERNQMYVDGGIMAMALIESLHYYGIASCVLQNGEKKILDEQYRKVCGNIPDNEKIICFIAIGYYKENIVYATSHRKPIDDVLIIK